MNIFLENKVHTLKINVFKKKCIKVDLLVKYSSQKKRMIWLISMPKNKFANFEEDVHNFGRSDDDMIYRKNAYFQYMQKWFDAQLD